MNTSRETPKEIADKAVVADKAERIIDVVYTAMGETADSVLAPAIRDRARRAVIQELLPSVERIYERGLAVKITNAAHVEAVAAGCGRWSEVTYGRILHAIVKELIPYSDDPGPETAMVIDLPALRAAHTTIDKHAALLRMALRAASPAASAGNTLDDIRLALTSILDEDWRPQDARRPR